MIENKLTAASLHPQARGRWLEIFQYVCPGLFDDAINSLGTHVNCPLHGGVDDFRFIKRARSGKEDTKTCGAAMCSCGVFPDGFALLHRARGGRFIDILLEVNEYLNGTSEATTTYQAPMIQPRADDPELAKKILVKVDRLWKKGAPLDTGKFTYYRNRGIDPRALEGLQNVRSTEKLAYYKKGLKSTDRPVKVGDYPALLANMQMPDGLTVAVHRTWLSQDRSAKAPIPAIDNKPAKVKKLSESPGCAGAAIRLFDATGEDILGLTEGIETALGVRQLSMGRYWSELGPLPVWACYSERNLRNFIVPPELLETLKKIIVFADSDARNTGSAAAHEFQARMAIEHPQLTVEIKVPEVVGFDWLDVLNNL